VLQWAIMKSTSQPTLFLSHGSPMIALEDSPAARFLDRLGPTIEATFGAPRAILVVSPHTATRMPVVSTGLRYEAIYDFGGFPAELYRQRYDVAGSPELSRLTQDALRSAGIESALQPAEGVDHGIWTLLKRAWPKADRPIVPVSLVPSASPAQQWAIGAALAGLSEQGVLIIGSGAFTHHLGRYFSMRQGDRLGVTVAPDVLAFQQWVAERAAARDWAALLDYRRQAPQAAMQHPTDEHWLPFYVAAGAGGADTPAQRLHDSVDGGVLAMDGYAFGPQAATLAQALRSASA
jgi:4,5-DOPA dioxygenase extradiol